MANINRPEKINDRVPPPPNFDLDGSAFGVPAFYPYNHAETNWVLNMVSDNRWDRMKQAVKENPDYFRTTYYQIVDSPMDKYPMFHRRAVLYLTAFGLAIYLKQLKMVKVMVESRLGDGSPLVSANDPCFAANIYSKHKKSADLMVIYPFCIMIRREFYESITYLLTAGWLPHGNIMLPYRRAYQCFSFNYRDALNYYLAQMRTKAGLRLAHFLSELHYTYHDNFHLKNYEKKSAQFQGQIYDEWVSIPRRLLRFCFFNDRDFKECGAILRAVDFLNDIHFFIGPTYHCLDISFEQRLQSISSTDSKERVVLDHDGCVAIFLALLQKAEQQHFEQTYKHGMKVFMRMIGYLRWSIVMLAINAEEVADYFSNIGERVEIGPEIVQKVAGHINDMIDSNDPSLEIVLADLYDGSKQKPLWRDALNDFFDRYGNDIGKGNGKPEPKLQQLIRESMVRISTRGSGVYTADGGGQQQESIFQKSTDGWNQGQSEYDGGQLYGRGTTGGYQDSIGGQSGFGYSPNQGAGALYGNQAPTMQSTYSLCSVNVCGADDVRRGITQQYNRPPQGSAGYGGHSPSFPIGQQQQGGLGMYGSGGQQQGYYGSGGQQQGYYGPGGQLQQQGGSGIYGPGGQLQQQGGSGIYGPGGQLQQQGGSGIYGPGGQLQQQGGSGIYGPGGMPRAGPADNCTVCGGMAGAKQERSCVTIGPQQMQQQQQQLPNQATTPNSLKSLPSQPAPPPVPSLNYGQRSVTTTESNRDDCRACGGSVSCLNVNINKASAGLGAAGAASQSLESMNSDTAQWGTGVLENCSACGSKRILYENTFYAPHSHEQQLRKKVTFSSDQLSTTTVKDDANPPIIIEPPTQYNGCTVSQSQRCAAPLCPKVFSNTITSELPPQGFSSKTSQNKTSTSKTGSSPSDSCQMALDLGVSHSDSSREESRAALYRMSNDNEEDYTVGLGATTTTATNLTTTPNRKLSLENNQDCHRYVLQHCEACGSKLIKRNASEEASEVFFSQNVGENMSASAGANVDGIVGGEWNDRNTAQIEPDLTTNNTEGRPPSHRAVPKDLQDFEVNNRTTVVDKEPTNDRMRPEKEEENPQSSSSEYRESEDKPSLWTNDNQSVRPEEEVIHDAQTAGNPDCTMLPRSSDTNQDFADNARRSSGLLNHPASPNRTLTSTSDSDSPISNRTSAGKDLNENNTSNRYSFSSCGGGSGRSTLKSNSHIAHIYPMSCCARGESAQQIGQIIGRLEDALAYQHPCCPPTSNETPVSPERQSQQQNPCCSSSTAYSAQQLRTYLITRLTSSCKCNYPEAAGGRKDPPSTSPPSSSLVQAAFWDVVEAEEGLELKKTRRGNGQREDVRRLQSIMRDPGGGEGGRRSRDIYGQLPNTATTVPRRVRFSDESLIDGLSAPYPAVKLPDREYCEAECQTSLSLAAGKTPDRPSIRTVNKLEYDDRREEEERPEYSSDTDGEYVNGSLTSSSILCSPQGFKGSPFDDDDDVDKEIAAKEDLVETVVEDPNAFDDEGISVASTILLSYIASVDKESKFFSGDRARCRRQRERINDQSGAGKRPTKSDDSNICNSRFPIVTFATSSPSGACSVVGVANHRKSPSSAIEVCAVLDGFGDQRKKKSFQLDSNEEVASWAEMESCASTSALATIDQFGDVESSAYNTPDTRGTTGGGSTVSKNSDSTRKSMSAVWVDCWK